MTQQFDAIRNVPHERSSAVTNLFDNAEGTFVVLTNEEGQHSLWPDFIDVPAGWTVKAGPAGRSECLDHIEKSWTDLRPDSLVNAMRAD